jgi:hypothetical protein
MAKIVRDSRDIPGPRIPIPQLRPPVSRFCYQDVEHPEEADEFIAMVRSLRRFGLPDEKRPICG